MPEVRPPRTPAPRARAVLKTLNAIPLALADPADIGNGLCSWPLTTHGTSPG